MWWRFPRFSIHTQQMIQLLLLQVPHTLFICMIQFILSQMHAFFCLSYRSKLQLISQTQHTRFDQADKSFKGVWVRRHHCESQTTTYESIAFRVKTIAHVEVKALLCILIEPAWITAIHEYFSKSTKALV